LSVEIDVENYICGTITIPEFLKSKFNKTVYLIFPILTIIFILSFLEKIVKSLLDSLQITDYSNI
jgi:hypothetical protein